MWLHAACLNSDCITADNLLEFAEELLYHSCLAVADLSAEHSDLHMKEEKGEEKMEALPPPVLFSFFP